MPTTLDLTPTLSKGEGAKKRLPSKVLSFGEDLGEVATMPFPQHSPYTKGTIKPNHLPQQQLDKQVEVFYDQWKKRYVKPGCNPDESYIWFERKGKECVSEGQGYGMIITVLMAG